MATKPIEIIDKFQFLLQENTRHKVLYGGRGSGKTENIARALIVLTMKPNLLFTDKKIDILCGREYQTTIQDSVHKVLKEVIHQHELASLFKITDSYIECLLNGSRFLFKGIANDPYQIKSLQNIKIAWIEEAEKVTNESWEILTPTIRSPQSEIWVSFNPREKTDSTYIRFIEKPMPNTKAVLVNYYDNPFFESSPIYNEMLYDKQYRPEVYNNKWLGNVKIISDALIFKDKYEVRGFETPELSELYENRFFYGLDFGYSPHPNASVRAFIQDQALFVDYEAGGVEVAIKDLPDMLDKIPEIRRWEIIADNARPETINHLNGEGFCVNPCKKGKGSVDEGIEWLKSFKKIIIHPRCEELIKEMGLYSKKIDKHTEQILPVIVDENNHYIDALRYAMEPYMRNVKVSVM
jgi:phage terminase large subunit